MKMTIPEGCGNSPRMTIVADIAVAWAAGEETTVREWLREDATWLLVGEDAPAPDGIVEPPFTTERGEILTVLNHGRLAARDGYLMHDEERVDFCHMIRFAGTTKTALIREIRTYLQRFPVASGSAPRDTQHSGDAEHPIDPQYPMDFRYSRESRMQSIGSRP